MTGKPDFERLGLFKEMSYITIGDKYNPTLTKSKRQNTYSGRQLLSGISKTKAGDSSAYFSEFQRILQGEAYNDVLATARKEKRQSSMRIIGKAWIPTSLPKKDSGVGGYFGTFAGRIEYFRAISQTSKHSSRSVPRNFLTSPPKKGAGGSFVDITLGKYPAYKADEYARGVRLAKQEAKTARLSVKGSGPFKLNSHPVDFFDTNPYKGLTARTRSAPPKRPIAKPFIPSATPKKDGGMKAGCFSPYPTHPADRYADKGSFTERSRQKFDKVFVPPPKTARTYPISSILNKNVDKFVTPLNSARVQQVVGY